MSLSELVNNDIPDDELMGKFHEFYRDMNYGEEIEKLADIRENSLDVDMNDVIDFDEEFSKEIRDNPDYFIYNAEEAVKEYYDYVDNIDNISVRFYNLRDNKMIRDLREDDIGRLVSIEGLVHKATDVMVRTSQAHFKCTSCGTWDTKVRQDREQPKYPEVCGNDDCANTNYQAFKFIQDKSKKVNYQKIKLQEPPEDMSGGESPQKIDVLVHGDIAGEMKPGKRVTVTGLLKSKKYTTGPTRNGTLKSTNLGQFVLCVNLKTQNKDFEDLEITEEDIKEIREISRRKDLYDYLSRSIAPTIKKTLDTEKEALMLQLFSGVRKNVAGGNSSIRGDIHVLLIGDPGTGKSEAINYVGKITPRGVTTNGKGSTSAGLTATAKKDSDFGGDENWTIEAGALPLSDKGIAVVDEIDKMNPKDRSSMHEALEQQTVSISKAGINTTLQSRCSLLAAANPEKGKYDRNLPISDQINLEPPLVSRFDLIFVIKDKVDEAQDTYIANSILESNIEGQLRARGELDEEDEEFLDTDIYRKYVAYARREVNPVMNEEAREKLKDFYVGLRKSGEDNDAIPVTARKMQALIRLAEASARARLGDEVTVNDADRVIEIVKKSIREVGVDPDTGELDSGRVHSGTRYREREEYNDLVTMITKLDKDKRQEEDDYRGLDENYIYQKAIDELGMDETEIEQKLNELDRNGLIQYPEQGLIKKL